MLALWTAIDLTYLWWMSERMMRSQGNFDSSAVPRLMPGKLQAGYMRIAVRAVALNRSGIGAQFLGAALGICRIKKEREEAA